MDIRAILLALAATVLLSSCVDLTGLAEARARSNENAECRALPENSQQRTECWNHVRDDQAARNRAYRRSRGNI